jgi:predicted nucleic acid-binding protein
MRVVVADTSPLNYLVLIDEISILPRLYDQILIPSEVLAELEDSGTPSEVRNWAQSRPAWLEVRGVHIPPDDFDLNQLDDGERAAILLAQQEPDVLLIIDDSAGRAEQTAEAFPIPERSAR